MSKNQYRDDVREFTREGTWTIWKVFPMFLLAIILIAGVVFGLRSLGIIGKTVVEREVFENSYQYTAGQKAKIATLEAQLAGINAQLMDGNLDAGTRSMLEAQKRSISVQLNTARSLSQ